MVQLELLLNRMLIFLDLGFLLLAEKDFSRWLRRTRGRDAWSPFLEENLAQLRADFKGSWCSPRLKCIVHGNTNVNETTSYIHLLQALKRELADFPASSFYIFHHAICHWKIIASTKLWTPFIISSLHSLFQYISWNVKWGPWSQIRLAAKMETASKLGQHLGIQLAEEDRDEILARCHVSQLKVILLSELAWYITKFTPNRPVSHD